MANKGTEAHNTQQASKDCSKQQVFRLHSRWITLPLLPKLSLTWAETQYVHYSLHSKDLRMKEVWRFSPWLSQLHRLPSSDLKFWTTLPWSLPGIQQGSVFLSILIQELLSFHQHSVFCNKNITAHKRSQNKEQQVELNAKWQFMPTYIPARERHAYPW